MGRPKKKRPVGRPLKNFDKSTFEALCGLQCTQAEICSAFETSDKTLTAWCKRTYGKGFQEVFADYCNKGKISLRRKQWRLADKNASMAQFLGKNYLGQKDTATVDVELSTDETVALMGDYFAKRKQSDSKSN